MGAARFTVRLTPRGGADRVDGVADGVLRVRVAATAVNDAANRALVRLIAHELDVAASTVRIVGGTTDRLKVLAVSDVDAGRLGARWPGLGTSRDSGGAAIT